MDSHSRKRRFAAEKQGPAATTRARDDRRLSASTSPFFTGIGGLGIGDSPGDRRGRIGLWPVFVPSAAPDGTEASTQATSFRCISSVSYTNGGSPMSAATMSRLQVLAHRAIGLDVRSTGPGPSFLVEAGEPARTDEPRARSNSAGAASRFRLNARLMALLLMDDRVVEAPNQDWQKVHAKRRAQRLRLEEKLAAMMVEIDNLEMVQALKRKKWETDAGTFRANLLKCSQREHLLEVARTMKVQGQTGQPTVQSSCKTAFRLKYIR